MNAPRGRRLSAGGVTALPHEAWRRLEAPNFPFFDGEFLRALEASASVGGQSGWTPKTIVVRDACGEPEAALPLYLKAHSYGEYIFDWDWARACQEHGIPYYPKLVSMAPLTPATGPHFLVRQGTEARRRDELVEALLDGIDDVQKTSGARSVHALFLPEAELASFERRGYVLRKSLQFQWLSRGERDFNDYLSTFIGKRRRDIVRERKEAQAHGLVIERLTGQAVTDDHARAMYGFYLATIDKKDSYAYLTEEFFISVFREMRERILLVTAKTGGELVAAALNFVKGDSLFGRYWGAVREYRSLHFELCYYQTLDFAFEHRLARFEAGAQGAHKIQRGFLPRAVYSAHRLEHPGFQAAIARYVEEEAKGIDATLAEFSGSPFKRDHQANASREETE